MAQSSSIALSQLNSPTATLDVELEELCKEYISEVDRALLKFGSNPDFEQEKLMFDLLKQIAQESGLSRLPESLQRVLAVRYDLERLI